MGKRDTNNIIIYSMWFWIRLKHFLKSDNGANWFVCVMFCFYGCCCCVWTMDHFGHDQIRFSAVTAAAAAALLPR